MTWDWDLSCNVKLQMPLTQNLVVCTLCDTIEILLPTKVFINVDFPEFGTPKIFTNPDLVLNF
jgi:hypothetical protein